MTIALRILWGAAMAWVVFAAIVWLSGEIGSWRAVQRYLDENGGKVAGFEEKT